MAVNSTSRTPTAPSTSLARRDSVGTGTGGRMATGGLLQSSVAASVRAWWGQGSIVGRWVVPRSLGATPGHQDNAPGGSGFPTSRPAPASPTRADGRRRDRAGPPVPPGAAAAGRPGGREVLECREGVV